MSKRRLTLALAALGAAATLAAGCGGGGGSSATTTSEGVSTDTWADGFCNAFSDWANALKPVAQTLTSTPTKANLQSAGDDIKSANKTLANDLKALGRPSIERGEEARNAVNNLADEVRADSDKISDALSDLASVSDVVAAAGVVTSTLTTLQTQVNDTVSHLNAISADSGDSLKDAIADASSCQSLTAGS
jgi:hypothetical protein